MAAMEAAPISKSDSRMAGATLPRSGRPQFGQGSASALSMKWSALHDAAAAVATIAGGQAPPLPQAVRAYPAVMRDAGGWRRDLAEQGIEDLTAIMEPGLAALLAALARGANPKSAAIALWREFVQARDSLLLLIPADGPGARRIG